MPSRRRTAPSGRGEGSVAGPDFEIVIKTEDERQAFFSSVAAELIRTAQEDSRPRNKDTGNKDTGFVMPRVSVAQLYKKARQDEVAERDFGTWVARQLDVMAAPSKDSEKRRGAGGGSKRRHRNEGLSPELGATPSRAGLRQSRDVGAPRGGGGGSSGGDGSSGGVGGDGGGGGGSEANMSFAESVLQDTTDLLQQVEETAAPGQSGSGSEDARGGRGAGGVAHGGSRGGHGGGHGGQYASHGDKEGVRPATSATRELKVVGGVGEPDALEAALLRLQSSERTLQDVRRLVLVIVPSEHIHRLCMTYAYRMHQLCCGVFEVC